MNPEIKAQWTAALRSGEYKQGRRTLAQRDDVGGPVYYCCLGVLCELAAQEGLTERTTRDEGRLVNYGGHGAFLPGGVMSWADIESESPLVPSAVLADDHPLKKDLKKYGDTSVSLAALNDEGLSFEQIADLIDTHL